MNIIEFKKSQTELLKVIKDFPENKRDEKFFDDWTIKEVIAHISGWDEYFSQVLNELKNGKAQAYWGNINSFNKRIVSKRKNNSFENLVTELKNVGDNFIKSYEDLKGKEKIKIWVDKKYTPQDILKIEIHHYDNQTKLIRKNSKS